MRKKHIIVPTVIFAVIVISVITPMLTQTETKRHETVTITGVVPIKDTVYIPTDEDDENPAVSYEPQPMFPIHTNMYRCMDYRKITAKNSDQYALQQIAFTDERGIRAVKADGEVYLCAALGGAYGYDIGAAYAVTLANGYSFNIVLSDFKHKMYADGYEHDYGDPDVNYMGDACLSVIEFVADMDVLSRKVIKAGTLSVLPEFGGLEGCGGDITEMRYIGKIYPEGREK